MITSHRLLATSIAVLLLADFVALTTRSDTVEPAAAARPAEQPPTPTPSSHEMAPKSETVAAATDAADPAGDQRAPGVEAPPRSTAPARTERTLTVEGRTGELTASERSRLDSFEQMGPPPASGPRSVLEGRLESGNVWRLTVTRTAHELCFRSATFVDRGDGTGYATQSEGCHAEEFTASGGRGGERGPQGWHGPVPADTAAVRVVAADGAAGQGFAYALREVDAVVFVAFVDCTESIVTFVAQDAAGATIAEHEPMGGDFLRCD